jgi:amino acid adenylation domain-containing protein
MIVDKLNLPREPDRTPVFQIMFLLQDANDNITLSLPNTFATRFPVIQKTAMFDITFNVTKNESGIIFDIQYNTDLYQLITIKNLCSHFGNLLGEIAHDPDQSIHQLEILSPDEINDLHRWNNTEQRYPRDSTLIQLFEEQSCQFPHKNAVVTPDGLLTYAELKFNMERIAAEIQKTDNSIPIKNSTIAICLNRNILLVPGILGVLKAGAAYLPLDPNYPEKRLEYMLDHSTAKIVITQSTVLAKLPLLKNNNRIVICIDQLEDSDNTLLRLHTEANDLACVIYTSGSTGQPKGVMVEHRNMVNILDDIKKKLNLSQSDRYLSVTSVSFDIFGLEIFLPLLTGAEVMLCPPCVTQDPEQLVNAIMEYQPTLIQATPATWGMIADLLLEKNISKQFAILCGGEALDKLLALKLEKIAAHVWNVYGPAETTIWSTYNEVVDGDTAIGNGFANTYCFVLDKHRHLLPIGIAGELYIGGAGVARGYINDVKMTQDKFIDNPLGNKLNTEACPRLYKTGDSVLRRCDGKLHYIGRNDDQIKIRGYRVEIQEITYILNACPLIKNSVIIALKERNDEIKIIAYYVPRHIDELIDINYLQMYLESFLPNHMIPTDYVQMESFPLNPNNKIDKNALPKIGNSLATKTNFYIGPENSMEHSLADIWQQVLKIDRVSTDASFFALGGHSLLIPQAIMSINHRFNTKITIRDFIENITVKKLSLFIETTLEKTI